MIGPVLDTQTMDCAVVQRVPRSARSRTPSFGTSAMMAATMVLMLVAAAACTPTVKVATDEPITINLNVNIKHEILVKVDKQLDDLFSKDSGLF